MQSYILFNSGLKREEAVDMSEYPARETLISVLALPHYGCVSVVTTLVLGASKKNVSWTLIHGCLSLIFHFIYPLTARAVGAQQVISQPVSSIFPCSLLPSGTWRTPDLSIPWCCLPTSSSVCLVFFPLSLCLARWFWPDLMNGRHEHTTAVCVSLRWSGGLRVVRLPDGSWHGLLRW